MNGEGLNALYVSPLLYSVGCFKRRLDESIDRDDRWDGEKELPPVGHQLASCSLLFMFL